MVLNREFGVADPHNYGVPGPAHGFGVHPRGCNASSFEKVLLDVRS